MVRGGLDLPGDVVSATGISKLRLVDGELTSEPISYTELTTETRYALVIYLRSIKWQEQPNSPLVLVDGLTNQTENTKLMLQNKLTELHALGQIVRINLKP